MMHLDALFLSGTSVTDAGLEQLTGFTKLGILELANTAVTDASLTKLKALPQLKTLNLSGTAITDAGLVHIKELGQLERLPNAFVVPETTIVQRHIWFPVDPKRDSHGFRVGRREFVPLPTKHLTDKLADGVWGYDPDRGLW